MIKKRKSRRLIKYGGAANISTKSTSTPIYDILKMKFDKKQEKKRYVTDEPHAMELSSVILKDILDDEGVIMSRGPIHNLFYTIHHEQEQKKEQKQKKELVNWMEVKRHISNIIISTMPVALEELRKKESKGTPKSANDFLSLRKHLIDQLRGDPEVIKNIKIEINKNAQVEEAIKYFKGIYSDRQRKINLLIYNNSKFGLSDVEQKDDSELEEYFQILIDDSIDSIIKSVIFTL